MYDLKNNICEWCNLIKSHGNHVECSKKLQEKYTLLKRKKAPKKIGAKKYENKGDRIGRILYK